MQKISKAIFVTATDTEVGKTVLSCALGLALKKKGIDVGIMKPLQCSGDDTDFLIKALELKDEKDLVNPYYAKEPLSPYTAFKKEKNPALGQGFGFGGSRLDFSDSVPGLFGRHQH